MGTQQEQHVQFYLSHCAFFIAIHCFFINQAWAKDYFDPVFLENHGSHQTASADLSVFATAQNQLPGTYYADILINNVSTGTRNVDFQQATLPDGRQVLQGCLHVDELKKAGVKTDLFPELHSAQNCADITQIPGASQQFDFQTQQLQVSIPQLYIANSAHGFVAPDQWQEGIPALLLNYSFSGYQDSGNDSSDNNSRSKYLALQPGVNIGPWRFRNYTNWNASTSDGNTQQSWNSVYNYLQRDIIALTSQFTAGDSSTPSDIFDSVSFRGIQLASDDQMQPDSLRGYAPTIRGIARSNAQVTIRQNGRVAYQTAVPPGVRN